MNDKNLLMPYRIAGGVLALVLAFLFGCTAGNISTQNEGIGNIGAETGNSDCVRSSYYSEFVVRVDPEDRVPGEGEDQDGDGILDLWESWWGLDPEDPGDAELDPDGDGYSNFDEYIVNADPFSDRVYPGVIPIIDDKGFDCFYTAEMGLINDDDLLDILIRDPSEGYLPAVRDFVMIQQADRSFVIEDAANHEIPELTSIQSALWLTEVNMDRWKDLALIGLSGFIPDVNDQLIFGNQLFGDMLAARWDFATVPRNHKEVSEDTHSFFQDLYRWTSTTKDYFDNRAPILATVPEVLDLSWFRDESGNVLRDSKPLSRESLPADCGVGLVHCFDVIADVGDLERFAANEIVSVDYTEMPYRIGLSDASNDPDEPDLHFLVRATFSENPDWQVKDYSSFNQDALSLARNELRDVRYSGVMFVPSDKSTAIFDVLRNYLGSPIFSLGYGAGGVRNRVTPWGVWPYELDIGRDERGKDTEAMGTVFYIRRVLDYISDRYISRPENLYEQ